MQKKHAAAGAVLVQILIVVLMIGILVTIVTPRFAELRQAQAIPVGVDEIAAVLNEARSRTLSDESGLQYGVHFASSAATLFSGTTYSSSASTNKVVTIDSQLSISSISLNGGGSDVIFNKLTGETDDYGTLIVKRASTTTGQRTITISKTGLISTN
jgi:Tfp pilus assembly protein FimT